MPKIKFTTKDMDLDTKPKKSFNPGDYNFKVVGVKLEIEDPTAGWVSQADRSEKELEDLSQCRQRMPLELTCTPVGSSDHELSFTVHETIWFTPKAAWKYKQFCQSVGLDSDAELDTNLFWDKEGLVYLSRKGDDKYLTPRKFLTESGQYTPAAPAKASRPVEEPPF